LLQQFGEEKMPNQHQDELLSPCTWLTRADFRLQSAGDWLKRLVVRSKEMPATVGLGKRLRFGAELDAS
jgi:hypothetical protein